MMKVKSVNVGEPRQIETPRGVVLTSIFKSPVPGRVAVRGYNLAGDRQSDLNVHGGPKKSIYAYPSEHHTYWANKVQREIVPGHFGENLTTEGLLETEVRIGSHYRVGSAILNVTEPRQPCYKLALRFDLPVMVKLFWESGLSGFYFGVVKEGEIAAGDEIELVKENPGGLTISEIFRRRES